MQNNKENDIEMHKRRINKLQYAIKQCNESDVTNNSNANNDAAMMLLQIKIDNVQMDEEKDNFHINTSQN